MKQTFFTFGIIAILAAAPARADLVLDDTSFTGWDTGSYSTGTAGAATVSISGGGSTLSVTTHSSGGTSLGYAYDPSTLYSGESFLGESYSITAQVSNGAGAAGNGQQFHFILVQNGSVYDDFLGVTGIGPNSPSYYPKTFTGTFESADFTLISGSGPAAPDLSGATASEIGFGSANLDSNTITQSYENISGPIQTTATPVPAPGMLSLFAPLVAVGLWLRWRRIARQPGIIATA